MYLSYNWLKDLVDIPQEVTLEDLWKKLTLHTVEVEGVERQEEKLRNIVVGQINKVKSHPKADKLQLVSVDVGTKEELNIVCGANNIEAGQKVPVALAGAVLPSEVEIKKTEVRGETSQGMLCAEDELGFGEDHSGILILDNNAKVGHPLAEHLGWDDILLEVENKSLTNRPDLMGHLGIAREISAFLNTEKTQKFNKIFTTRIKNINQKELDIKIEHNELCHRYMGIRLSNITVQDSPEWLQKRLSAIGVRPINNIVDITNYVMFELGQPLHAFDGEKVEAIRVRQSKEGETIRTLDGEDRELFAGTLVIADKEKPIALAGIMGGEETGVIPDTSTVILEAANFNPIHIRKNSQKIGIRTDSSTRFEKSLDPYLLDIALARCEQLIREICPEAELTSALTDIAEENDRKNEFNLDRGPIELDLNEVNNFIGIKIIEEEVVDILTKLGFKTEKQEDSDRTLRVTIPTWRGTKDISIKEDLMEEIVRIYGYHNLPPTKPTLIIASPEPNFERNIERKIKNVLAEGADMSETYNYSFTNEEKLRMLNLDPSEYIRLANPISNHHTLLRQNLMVNLVDNIRQNQANYVDISMFEIGNIYLNMAGTLHKNNSNEEKLPHQELIVGMVEGSEKEDVFYRIKGKIEYLLDYFDISVQFQPVESPLEWAPREKTAKILADGKDVGVVGEVRKDSLKSLNIKKKTAVAEIRFEDIVQLSRQKRATYQSLSKYPPLERDLAFVVDAKTLFNDINKEIENFSDLIKKVELFDVYQGSKLGEGQKSLAFHITYRSEERTLQSEEVDQLQNNLFKKLEEKFGAKVRDF